MKPHKHSMPYAGGVPRHWQCRSTEVPYLKTFKELGFDADEFPEGTQWTPDGEVAGDMSFEDWLRSKSDDEVEGMLGKKRADMFLNQKMTLGQFLDMSGRPLTLDQLESGVHSLEDGLSFMQKHIPRTRQVTKFAAQQFAMYKAANYGTEKLINWMQKGKLPKPSITPVTDTEGLIGSSIAQTIKQLTEVKAIIEALERTGLKAGNLNRIRDVGQVRDIASEIDRCRLAFPEVEVGHLLTDQLAVGELAESVYGSDLKALRFNHHFLNSTDLPEYLSGLNKSRWRAPVGDDMRSVVTHEFGHQVLFQLDRVAGVGSSQRVRKFLTDSIKKLPIDDISEYGLSNIDELFAETFMACQWLPESQWTPWMRVFKIHIDGFLGDRNWDALGFHGGT